MALTRPEKQFLHVMYTLKGVDETTEYSKLSFANFGLHLQFTWLPSIFMTGVHPPSPHPKSPI